MRPVIARRITTCHYCGEGIVKGSERLTDYIRVKSAQSKIGWVIVRRHFHFRKDGEELPQSCHDKWMTEIFARMPPHIPLSNNPKGRPTSSLTVAQKGTRRELLKRMASQIRYYIKEGNLDLSEPKYLTEVTLKDVRKATRFRDNLTSILNELALVGGIPEKYRGYLEEEDKEEKVA